MEEKIFIYGLIDPTVDLTTNNIRYVGKSKIPSVRYGNHISSRLNPTTPVAWWIKKLFENDLRPKLVILEETTDGLWEAIERHFIANLPNLLNLSTGGEGGSGVFGEAAGSKLKEQEAIDICAELAIGTNGRILADRYEISFGSISAIRAGKVWKHLGIDLTNVPFNTSMKEYTLEKSLDICNFSDLDMDSIESIPEE